MTIEIKSALIGGASAALISSAISFLATIITTFLNNRSEERKLKMQLAVNASMTEFSEKYRFVAETKSRAVKVNPIPHLVHIAYYALSGITESSKSEKRLMEHLQKVYAFQEMLQRDLENHLKEGTHYENSNP